MTASAAATPAGAAPGTPSRTCERDTNVTSGEELLHAVGAPGDGGGRGDSQVGALKDHAHGGGHLDDLAVHEAELLVVVQHGVHVLNPDGVHGPVEHDPLAVRGGVGRSVAEEHRQHTVGPLVADHVKLAVELPHGDGLGVEAEDLHCLHDGPRDPRRLHVRQRAGQHAVTAGLPREGLTHDHKAVAHHNHLKQLDGLAQEVRRGLKVLLRAVLGDVPGEVRVVRLREHHSGEEVAHDAVKERDVHVDDGPQHQHVLVLVGVGALQVAGSAQHGNHGAHAVVVVVLRGELLRAQLVGGHDLLRALARLEVAEGVEDDLADHGVVRHHHRHRAE
eukprot:1186881-Prorocentrum_minimum.AAC.1